jgi:hypothetical protein
MAIAGAPGQALAGELAEYTPFYVPLTRMALMQSKASSHVETLS